MSFLKLLDNSYLANVSASKKLKDEFWHSFNFVITPPKTYTEAKEIEILITGCQGENSQAQKDVANCMQRSIVKDKPTLGILLGDNFYKWGVSSPTDPAFEDYFVKTYPQTIPWLACLGNHDYNFQHPAMAIFGKGTYKYKRAMAQVQRTYLNLDQWFMPFRYYYVPLQYHNLFFLDSNTFIWDTNQQKSFASAYAELNKDTKKKNHMFMHHPLKSIGKRHSETENDLRYYLSSGYNKHLGGGSFNKILRETFIAFCGKNNIKIDNIFSAHDHFLATYSIAEKSFECTQFVSCGGGNLQTIMTPEIAKTSVKKHGFWKLKLNGKETNTQYFVRG